MVVRHGRRVLQTAATLTGCKAQKNLTTIWYSEEESRVPYTPYHPTHYLYCAEKTA